MLRVYLVKENEKEFYVLAESKDSVGFDVILGEYDILDIFKFDLYNNIHQKDLHEFYFSKDDMSSIEIFNGNVVSIAFSKHNYDYDIFFDPIDILVDGRKMERYAVSVNGGL